MKSYGDNFKGTNLEVGVTQLNVKEVLHLKRRPSRPSMKLLVTMKPKLVFMYPTSLHCQVGVLRKGTL